MNQNASISVRISATDYQEIKRLADEVGAEYVDVISAALGLLLERCDAFERERLTNDARRLRRARDRRRHNRRGGHLQEASQ